MVCHTIDSKTHEDGENHDPHPWRWADCPERWIQVSWPCRCLKDISISFSKHPECLLLWGLCLCCLSELCVFLLVLVFYEPYQIPVALLCWQHRVRCCCRFFSVYCFYSFYCVLFYWLCECVCGYHGAPWRICVFVNHSPYSRLP